jgi:uncharacterized protein YjbI with pentapeptide repeats
MNLFYDKVRKGETNFAGYILKNVDFSKNFIHKIGTKNQELYFDEAKFYGDFSAQSVNFLGTTSFMDAEFHGNVDFQDSTFLEETLFYYAKFYKDTKFYTVDFKKNFHFNNVIFFGSSTFLVTTFDGFASFNQCEFKKYAVFADVKFMNKGNFSYAKIDSADFENTDLSDVNFNNVNPTNFKLKGTILNNTDFSNSIWDSKWKSPWRKYIVREDKEAGYGDKICSYCNQVILSDSNLCERCGSIFINTNQVSCPNCNSNIDKNAMKCSNKKCDGKFSVKSKNDDFYDSNERILMFKKAESVYRKIKLNFQNNGDYQTAGDFFYNERIMKRKGLRFKNKYFGWLFPNFIIDHLYSKLCGYGERPGRVIISAIMLVLAYSFMYTYLNAVMKRGFIDYTPNFLENIYFNIVTFTTLGYGDYAPKQTFQLLATSEAFIGAFMIALFVLVFGRKMLR